MKAQWPLSMTGFVLQGHIAFSKSTLSDLSTLQVHSCIHRGIVVYAQLFSVRDWFVSEDTGLLFCAAVCGASSRRKDPEARGPSAVIHFLFRLALFLSSVIMAALKHYQPCLQIWNPKVSDFPCIIYIASSTLVLCRGGILSVSCDIKVGQFYYHYTGKLLAVCCVGDAASFSLSVYMENNPN